MTDYLVIGGTGSLGRKLIARLLPQSSVAVFSRDEAKHWTIRNAIGGGALADRSSSLRFYVGDVRDLSRLRDVIRQTRPLTVIIAAALKQVDTCELSPTESIATNLLGVQNAIDATSECHDVRLVLLVSTDKACAPVNVYGMCKAIAERLVTSQALTGRRDVHYLAVRYGNVLESRGSIVPLFRHQADHAAALTVTHPDMTRFVMTLDESVNLILHALEYGQSGETWVPRLPAMRVGDLAALFARQSGKRVEVTGLRPGEKMHEDLVNESESPRTRRDGDHYVIAPAFAPGSGERFTYTSADEVLTELALEAVLSRVLSLPMDQFVGREIEEIRKDGR